MKKFTFFFVLGLYLSLNAFAQQLTNGGFENWHNKVFSDPTGFISSNQMVSTGIANVTKVTTGTFHGTAALKLETVLSGTDTIIGSVTRNMHYTGTPDSISAWVKGAIGLNDSCTFVVSFLKSGSTIARARIAFTGTNSSYKRFSIPTNLVSSNAPDSLTITITSSKQNNLRKVGSTLTIDSINFKHSTQQLPNNDFENWTTITGSQDPDGWGTNAGLYPAYNAPVLVTKTADAHSGSSAVKLISTIGVNPLPFGTGASDTICGTLVYGMKVGQQSAKLPFPYKPDSLSVYVKGTVATGFSSNYNYIFALLSNKGTMMGMIFYQMTASLSSYTRISSPVYYFDNTLTPDSATFVIYTSNYQITYPGNEFYVDDLKLVYNSTGLNENSTDPSLMAYTDAASNNLQIVSLNDQNLKISIFNLSGQIVENSIVQGSRTIDISHYSAGLYLYRFESKEGKVLRSGKFIRK